MPHRVVTGRPSHRAALARAERRPGTVAASSRRSFVMSLACISVFLLAFVAVGLGARRALAAGGPPAISNVHDRGQVTAVVEYFFKFDRQERGDAVTLGSQGVATVTSEICAALARTTSSADIRLLLDDLSAQETATLTRFGAIVKDNGALDRVTAAGASADDLGMHPERYMDASDAVKVKAILLDEAKVGAKARIIGWILFSAFGVQYVPK